MRGKILLSALLGLSVAHCSVFPETPPLATLPVAESGAPETSLEDSTTEPETGLADSTVEVVADSTVEVVPDNTLEVVTDNAVVESSEEAASSYPATCEQVLKGEPYLDVTLYLDGNPSKPWNARCVTTDAGTAAYLILVADNYSTYPTGACATAEPSSIKTTWKQVRIDPVKLLVTTNDYAGAISQGTTHEISGNGQWDYLYKQMPFASARTCSQSPAVLGKVDLTGTPFRVREGQEWNVEGFMGTGDGVCDAKRKVVDLTVGGFPAGVSPCKDYYTNQGGECLQLEYSQ